MRKNKNKSCINLNSIRQNLTNKIKEALMLKYRNYFSQIKYDSKSLTEDINSFIQKENNSKDPKVIFNEIELNIMNKIKSKSPAIKLDHKTQKLPPIKTPKATLNFSNLNKPKNLLYGNHYRTINSLGLKNGRHFKNNKKISGRNNDPKLIRVILNRLEKDKDESITLKIQGNSTRHVLVDRLKNLLKYDMSWKNVNEDTKLYEKEQEEKRINKKLQQNKYLNELKTQIQEKDKIKEEEKKNKIKELEDINKKILLDKEKEIQDCLMKKIKKEDLKKNYEQCIKEKEVNRFFKFDDKEKEEKTTLRKIKLEKQRSEILSNNKIGQNKYSILIKKCPLNKNKFISESKTQENERKDDYGIIDRKWLKELDEYKKELENTINNSNIEELKIKEEERKYRQNMEKEYNLYLKEEEQKRIKLFEKYKNYKKDLEKQIQDNKNKNKKVK